MYICILYSYICTAAAKSLQSCPTLCDSTDGSPPGSPVPGILQARTLEWVAISFSNAWKWKVKVNSLSRVWPSATPWTAAFQAPSSMGFSRQEYWSGVPLPSPYMYYIYIYTYTYERERGVMETHTKTPCLKIIRIKTRASSGQLFQEELTSKLTLFLKN